MLTISELKKRIFDKLRSFYYEKICGYVKGQLRNNVKLVKLTSRITSGIFTNKTKYIKLPSGTFYHLYECNNVDVSWLHKTVYQGVVNQYKWITLESLCNDFNVNIDVYTSSGLMIPKKLVYITSPDLSSNFLSYFAIDHKAIQYIPNIEKEDIYITIMLDTSIENDITVNSYVPGINTENQLLYLINKYNSFANKEILSLYINGWYMKEPPANLWNTNSMKDKLIELVINNNVSFAFTQHERYKYFSNIDSSYKDLIHIPKQYASNRIITINLLYIYVYDKNNKRGVKLPFTINANTYQVTHNDMGIPGLAIDSVCSLLYSENIDIHVKVMKFQQELDPLVFDGQSIKLLYEYLDDNEIVNILLGNVELLKNKVDAPTLEQSAFITLLNEKINLENYSEENLNILVDGIGYANVYEIIGNTKFEVNITNVDNIEILSVNKNILMEDNQQNNFLPYLFLNGVKLNNELINAYTTQDKCVLKLYKNIIVDDTRDKLDIIINPEPRIEPIKIIPNNSINNVSLQNYGIKDINQVDVYIKKNISTYNLKNYNNDLYHEGYLKLEENIKNSYVIIEYDEINEHTKFIFTNNSFGKELIIVPKTYSVVYQESRGFNPQNKSIYIEPTIKAIDVNNGGVSFVPFLNINDIDIFINGKLIIKNIGYNETDIVSFDGHYVQKVITIQDKDYFDFSKENTIEIIGKTSKSEDELSGFVVNNYFGSNDKINNLWLYNSSLLFINGKYIRNENIEYQYKDTFKTKFNVPNISEFIMKTSLPSLLSNVIDEYLNNNYFTTISSILNYLVEVNGENIINPSTVIVTKYKTIYSSFVNDVLIDIANRVLPDYIHNYTEEEIKTLLQEFEYKKKFDLVMNNQVFTNISDEFKFSNLEPNWIEVHSGLTFDPRQLTEEQLSTTKIILLKTIVEYVLVTKHYFDNE